MPVYTFRNVVLLLRGKPRLRCFDVFCPHIVPAGAGAGKKEKRPDRRASGCVIFDARPAPPLSRRAGTEEPA